MSGIGGMAGFGSALSRSNYLGGLRREDEEDDPISSMLREAEERRAQSMANLQRSELELAALRERVSGEQEQAIQGPKPFKEMSGREKLMYSLTEVLPKALLTFSSSNPSATAAGFINDMLALREDAKQRRERAVLERLDAELGFGQKTVEAQRRAALDAENDLNQRRWDAGKLVTQEAGDDRRAGMAEAGRDRRAAEAQEAALERVRIQNEQATQRLYASHALSANRDQANQLRGVASDFGRKVAAVGGDPMMAYDLALRVAVEGEESLDEDSMKVWKGYQQQLAQNDQNAQANAVLGALTRDINTGTSPFSPRVGPAGRLDVYSAAGGTVTPELRKAAASATGDPSVRFAEDERKLLDSLIIGNPDATAEQIADSFENLTDDERVAILDYVAWKHARDPKRKRK